MVLVNRTKMKISVIKTDGNVLAVKPESHIFVSEETIKSYPSFIEAFTDEDFNKLNKEKKIEKSSKKEVEKTPKVEKTTDKNIDENIDENIKEVVKKIEEDVKEKVEEKIEETKETPQTKAPRRRRKPKNEIEKKESK